MTRHRDIDGLELERLAALEIPTQQGEDLSLRLARVLESVAVLDRADLDGVPPTHRLAAPDAGPREDEVRPSVDPARTLAGVPRAAGGEIAVPSPHWGEDES